MKRSTLFSLVMICILTTLSLGLTAQGVTDGDILYPGTTYTEGSLYNKNFFAYAGDEITILGVATGTTGSNIIVTGYNHEPGLQRTFPLSAAGEINFEVEGNCNTSTLKFWKDQIQSSFLWAQFNLTVLERDSIVHDTIYITGTDTTLNYHGNQETFIIGEKTIVRCPHTYKVTVKKKEESTPTNVNETSWHSNTLTVYPNPSRGQVNVKCDLSEPTVLQVFDMGGRVVFNRQLTVYGYNQVSIDLTDQPKGMYIVRAGSSVSKLVLN
jgi:hypothetical protein